MATIVETPAQKKPWALKELPAFPQVAVRLLDVLSKADAAMKEIVELVRLDPAFGGEVLRLANSAAFGLRSQVDSLGHAIALLGTTRIKAVAMTVAMSSYARQAFKHRALRSCWSHSLATAFLTEELAAACSINEDRGYTAGLMHEIGRLALLVGYPNEYSNLIVVASENALDLRVVERAMFDVDYAEAGEWLAEEWRFPAELKEIISHHGQAGPGGALKLGTLVHLGCRMADTMGFHTVKPIEPWSFDEILEKLPPTARPSFPSQEELTDRIGRKVTAFGG
ncbi:MAG: HDOD domain-containing protein [Bryobacteraceae bacterium]